MSSLRGQNFRILILDVGASEFKCIGMATSCTVNLTANTDDASTKDDIGGSAKPEVTSNSWSVSVESLNVLDAGAMLNAIRKMKPFTLMWDETSTQDNQASEAAPYQRIGSAYLSDITLNFDNRTNSAKSLQFTGTGGLVTDNVPSGRIDATAYTKGQFIRLFIASGSNPSKVIAGAKTLQIHASVSLEVATTKDTEGNWQVQEPTGYTYDISTTALVSSYEIISSGVGDQKLGDLMVDYQNSTLMYWQIANVSGANNRTKGSIIASGQAYITSLDITGQNRQVATYEAKLSGYGDLAIGQ